MLKNSTKCLSRAGLIAGLYVVLSLLVFPVASGAVQFRASELLTILPLIFPEAVPALFVGCFISNLLTGCVIIDVVLGSIITLVAGVFTYICGGLFHNRFIKVLSGGFFPIVLNAFLLPLIWVLCYGAPEFIYIVQALILLLSQGVVIYVLGIPTYFAVIKMQEKGGSFLC